MINRQERPTCLTGEVRIIVKSVEVQGRGVILLTGPSSCGKGEIAKALCRFLSIPAHRHLSMGSILRTTVSRAREDAVFRQQLADEYGISDRVSILDRESNPPRLVQKAEEYRDDLAKFVSRAEGGQPSQLDWLEYCVTKGLLVPDDWTEKIITAVFTHSPELRSTIFILDGYPRTTPAARHLLQLLSDLEIPVIKAMHMAITKEQMKVRALNRGRLDDTEESLERRYQFYIDRVQPCIDYLKDCLGSSAVALIDGHQPVYNQDGELDLEGSIHAVVVSVMQALGLPGYLLEIR
ncbi:MAG: nucleoside monophosphate kinase [Bacillota bacterium]